MASHNGAAEELVEKGFTVEDATLMAKYLEPSTTDAPSNPYVMRQSQEDLTADSIKLKLKRGVRSVDSKRLRRKVYRNKKKVIKHDKYYNELCEKGLKKRYRSIPINNKLPIGTLESEETEEDINNSQMVACTEEHQSAVCPVDTVENYSNDDTFDSVLIPIEEGLPCSSNNIVSVSMCKEAVMKARAERNDALLLAKHYRDVTETLKLENKNLREDMEGRIIDIRKQAAADVSNMKTIWRNQIVEGGSRAGKILRAALLRK